MFTHPKSTTVRVLRMLMHLSAGHVTLLPGEISTLEIFPKSDLRADSRWALSQIASCLFFFIQSHHMAR